MTDAGLVLGCVLEPEQLAVEIDKRGSHTWDALLVGDTIHLVYEVPTCLSEPQLRAQRLDYLTFKSTGAFGEAAAVVNGAESACYFTRTPTLSPSKSDKPLLYYTSTQGDLAWVVDVVKEGEAPRISLQPLDKSGGASGDSHELTQRVGALSNVSIAVLPEAADKEYAGAVVYSIAPDDLHAEVRFRTIAHDGTVGPERSLTNAKRNAHSVSITPFGGGNVVAFRNVDAAATSINLAFISTSGTMATFGERTLIGARPSGEGGPPKVFVTSDGRISVVFTDTDQKATTLRAVRAICDP